MEFENLLKILKKRMLYFVLTSILIFFVFFMFLVKQPRVYQASAKILMMPERRMPSGPGGTYREDMPNLAEMMKFETRRNMETQLEIMKSNEVRRSAEKMSGMTYGRDVKYCTPQQTGESDVVTITCEGQEDNKVVKFTNKYSDAYTMYLRNLRMKETMEAGRFFEKQLDDARSELGRAEERLREFKIETGIVDLGQESSKKVQNLVDTQTDLDDCKIDLAAVRSKIQEAQEQLNSSDKELISMTVMAENPVVQQLKGRLANLEVEYAGMSRSYSDKHPDVVRVAGEIDRTKSKLQSEMEKIIQSQTKTLNPVHTQLMSDLATLKIDEISYVSRKDTLTKTIAELQLEMAELPEDEVDIARLVREKMLQEKTFVYLKDRYQDFRISQKTENMPARVIERAEVAKEASRTKKIYSTVLGILIALSFGIGVAFMIEYMDDAIYTLEDVKRYLDLKVLAQIPFDETIMKEPLITHHRPNSPVTESFRALRNKLKYLVPDFRGKSFLITSSIIEEGKSFVASNLAITLAQYELSVLLIDGDLRRPALHQYFNVENKGLTNVLINNEEPESVTIPTSIKGLDLMCSGPLPLIETSPFNSSELLESKRMSKIIESLKTKYDVIVIDSPPVLVLTDVLSLSLHASGILFVIDSGYVKRDDSVDAKSELELSSAPIFGAILNKTEGKSRGYYKYLYYYREETTRS